jgi:peroxiredoxin
MPLLQRGELIRDFCLPSLHGEAFLSDVRERHSMVLLLAADHSDPSIRALLCNAPEQYSRITAADGVVAAVLTLPPDRLRHVAIAENWLFPAFSDRDGAVHSRLAAVHEDYVTPTVYVTDRFGEIYGSFARPLPSLTDLIGWLDFIGIQCEECFPPEWPR